MFSTKTDVKDFEVELLLAIGARVMFTSNKWKNARIINNALGVVEQFVYNPWTLHLEPPTYVLIGFDKYKEVPWDGSTPQNIPITPIGKGNWKQLPLKLAWSLTVYKFEELTLEKATINIGKQER